MAEKIFVQDKLTVKKYDTRAEMGAAAAAHAGAIIKELLAKNKLRFDTPGEYNVKEERDYRIIPSNKWMSTLGVTRFDKVADFENEKIDPQRVEISLSAHIGKPSVFCVSDGDKVEKGDLIADAADGLSLPQHASITGTVTLSNGKIIIDRIR